MALYADADFAGCRWTRRSTSGYFMALSGPNTNFPLSAYSKRQSSVAHSTPEAEIVAADTALRLCGVPALELSEVLLDKSVPIQFYEDSTAMVAIMKSGRNARMRHLNRTHDISME